MKTMIKIGVALALVLAVVSMARAEETTLSGTLMCAKCALKEGDKCQNVIQAKEGGKTVTYYLTKNDVSNDFHSNICKEAKKVTATGTVKEVDGKKQLTASKIELAKE